MAPPRIAFYGDDFTGATDTLATASRAGLRTMLFLRVPDARQLSLAGALDIVGIAGASRSMSPADMAAELGPVRDFFAGLGAPVVHYKTCSTFDSAPAIGSIGAAVAILRLLSPYGWVAIVGGQPNLNRYCLFGNLFACVEIGGEVHRIDRHATMSRHPVTPMTEADLRIHLGRQGLAPIASVDYTRYDLDADALDRDVDARLDARFDANAPTRPAGLLFDVARADDLAIVGRQLWLRATAASASGRGGPLLVVGPSSVTQALIAHWRRGPEATDGGPPCALPENVAADPQPALAPARGPVLVLAGSLSGVTARQRARATSYCQHRIDPQRLVEGGVDAVGETADAIVGHLRDGRHVLVHTAPADYGSAAGQADPALARASGALLQHLLHRVRLSRVGIAGGDTSSHAVRALDLWGLTYLGQVAPGTALCAARSDDRRLDGIELMLKGGQMGLPDVFERLIGAGPGP